MPSGPSPPKAPGKVAPPSTLQPRPTTPDNDDAISPTPSRGPLHRPPSPGGGGWLYSAFYQRPRLPTCLERLPPRPPLRSPRPSRRANWRITKGHHIFPQPPRGGGLSTGHTGRGGMLYTIPPQTPRPPDGPEGLPLRPPASTPGQAVERTGQSLKAPYLSPEPGASPTTPPAGGTWLSSAYHPKPRRQIDRDGATPAKEGATLLGKTKAPGPIAPPPPASGNPPMPPSANWRRGI
ncbi:hypothetical protein N7530_010718 [Penicillium desertorum]|uniref:Uncharacterized protein n=1 Tax=Penicillium desertorum TaxID=1303715 RepID=A0A9W9WG32_9EURO|nr:hypothetical protein N7530_010718 [Penicillium desertorum]